ncbi:hypothetical protein ACFY36_01335 [Actinoplanes sp. NPDC000266]
MTGTFGSDPTTSRPTAGGEVTREPSGRAIGLSFDGRPISPDLAGRFRECDQTKTRLESGRRHLDVTGPWAGDRRTFPVRADDRDTGAELARRLLSMEEFTNELTREGDPIDSITLLTSGKQGRELQAALAGAGHPVRVYEASTTLRSEGPLAITDGGHWDIHGKPTPTHDFALSYELIRARQKSFPYAKGDPLPAGAPVPSENRAETLRLLDEAATEGLTASGKTLDLVTSQKALAASERPGVLWSALMRLHRPELGGVEWVVDLHRDPVTGDWRTMPGQVRRLYGATSRHIFAGDIGRRGADFNRTGLLLVDDAVTEPMRPEGLAVHLAESAADAVAQGLTVPSAAVHRDLPGLRNQVAEHLDALGVDAGALLGAMFDAEPADLPATIAIEEVTTGTAVSVPLGAGIHIVLEKVLGEDSPAVRSAFAVAAHFQRDRIGADVDDADVAQAAGVDSQVAGLLGLVALAYEAVARVLDPGAPVTIANARDSAAALIAVADPNVLSFTSSHEGLIRVVLAERLGPTSDGSLWDRPVMVGDAPTTARAMLHGLLAPGRGAPGQAVPGSSAAEPPVGSWHLPQVGLWLAGEGRPGIEETATTARLAAALLTAIDTTPDGPERVEAVSRDLTDPDAVGDFRDLLDQLRARHAALDALVREASKGLFRRAVQRWLAPALAALPRGVIRDNSAQRVGEVLSMARVARRPRTDWTAPALATEFSGRWRQIMVGSLFELPNGTVSLVWAQRADDPEHLLLVQRSQFGLTVVETVGGRAGARIYQPSDEVQALAVMDGPVRALVGAGARILGLEPGAVVETDVLPVTPSGWAPPAIEPVTVERGVAVVRVNAAVDDVADLIDRLRDVTATSGFVVVEGLPGDDPRLTIFRAVARGYGLGTLTSAGPEPVVQTGDHLISPSGWRTSGLDREVRDDHRGALSWAHLDALHRGARPPAGLSDDEAALVAEVNWRLRDRGPVTTREILDARRQHPLIAGSRVTQLAIRISDYLRSNRQVGRLVGGSAAAAPADDGVPVASRSGPSGAFREPASEKFVSVALTELARLFGSDLLWKSARVNTEDGLLAREFALSFGNEMKALFISSLSGMPTAPAQMYQLRRIESAEVVQGLATAAFLLGASSVSDVVGPLPFSVRPGVYEAVLGLASQADADRRTARFRAGEAGRFLLDPKLDFSRQLASRLNSLFTLIDESAVAGPEVFGPGSPVPNPVGSADRGASPIIDLQLLDGDRGFVPLALTHSAWSSVNAEFGPDSQLAVDLHGQARSMDLGEYEKVFGSWRDWRPFLDGAVESRTVRRTLVVSGLSGVRGGRPYIGAGEQGLTPARLLTGDHRRVVLRLAGSAGSGKAFAQELQYLADSNALRGEPAPWGVVLVLFDANTGQDIFQVVHRHGQGFVRALDLDTASTIIEARGRLIDPVTELRARINGHSHHPERTTTEIFEALEQSLLPPASGYEQVAPGRFAQVEKDPADAWRFEPLTAPHHGLFGEKVSAGKGPSGPSGSWPDDQRPGVSAETELRVPIRDGATAAEVVDAVRLWLRAGTVREVVVPGPGRPTVAVRVDPGLRAQIVHLPAVAGAHAVRASIVRPAAGRPGGTGVWVNRYRAAAEVGPPRLVAVPLDPDVADWSVLDSLPGDVIDRLIIEPGRHVGAVLTVHGEDLSAPVYRERLPDTGDAHPIVILQTPFPAERRDLRFVEDLAEKATVLVIDYDGTDNGRWRVYPNGDPQSTTLSQDLFGRFLAAQSNRSGPDLAQALRELQWGRPLRPDSEAALQIRRFSATTPVAASSHVEGWVSRRAGSPRSGRVHELFGHHAAGLVPLWSTNPVPVPPGQISMLMSVPARYASPDWPGTGDRGSFRVVDLHAMGDVAVLLRSGQVVVPDQAGPDLLRDDDLIGTLRSPTPEAAAPERTLTVPMVELADLLASLHRPVSGGGAGRSALASAAADFASVVVARHAEEFTGRSVEAGRPGFPEFEARRVLAGMANLYFQETAALASGSLAQLALRSKVPLAQVVRSLDPYADQLDGTEAAYRAGGARQFLTRSDGWFDSALAEAVGEFLERGGPIDLIELGMNLSAPIGMQEVVEHQADPLAVIEVELLAGHARAVPLAPRDPAWLTAEALYGVDHRSHAAESAHRDARTEAARRGLRIQILGWASASAAGSWRSQKSVSVSLSELATLLVREHGWIPAEDRPDLADLLRAGAEFGREAAAAFAGVLVGARVAPDQIGGSGLRYVESVRVIGSLATLIFLDAASQAAGRPDLPHVRSALPLSVVIARLDPAAGEGFTGAARWRAGGARLYLRDHAETFLGMLAAALSRRADVTVDVTALSRVLPRPGHRPILARTAPTGEDAPAAIEVVLIGGQPQPGPLDAEHSAWARISADFGPEDVRARDLHREARDETFQQSMEALATAWTSLAEGPGPDDVPDWVAGIGRDLPEAFPTVAVSPADLDVLLDRPGWMAAAESPVHVWLGAAASRFGDRVAAQLAARLVGDTVRPMDLPALANVESVQVSGRLARLAFRVEAARLTGIADLLPVRPARSLAVLIANLDPAAGDFFTGAARLRAGGARMFLQDPRTGFREELAAALAEALPGRSVDLNSIVPTTTGLFDDPAAPDQLSESTAIDVQLLDGRSRSGLLPAEDDAWSAVAQRFGPAVSEVGWFLHMTARTGVGRQSLERLAETWPAAAELLELGDNDGGRSWAEGQAADLDSGPSSVFMSLTNIDLLMRDTTWLTAEPSPVQQWLARSADDFGQRTARHFVGVLAAVAPADAVDLSHFSDTPSVRMVQTIATLAFRQEAAHVTGLAGLLPVRPVRPLFEVIAGLDPGAGDALRKDARFRAGAVRIYLEDPETSFLVELAFALSAALPGRLVRPGELILARTSLTPAGTPLRPLAVEVQLLDGEGSPRPVLRESPDFFRVLSVLPSGPAADPLHETVSSVAHLQRWRSRIKYVGFVAHMRSRHVPDEIRESITATSGTASVDEPSFPIPLSELDDLLGEPLIRAGAEFDAVHAVLEAARTFAAGIAQRYASALVGGVVTPDEAWVFDVLESVRVVTGVSMLAFIQEFSRVTGFVQVLRWRSLRPLSEVIAELDPGAGEVFEGPARIRAGGARLFLQDPATEFMTRLASAISRIGPLTETRDLSFVLPATVTPPGATAAGSAPLDGPAVIRLQMLGGAYPIQVIAQDDQVYTSVAAIYGPGGPANGRMLHDEARDDVQLQALQEHLDLQRELWSTRTGTITMKRRGDSLVVSASVGGDTTYPLIGVPARETVETGTQPASLDADGFLNHVISESRPPVKDDPPTVLVLRLAGETALIDSFVAEFQHHFDRAMLFGSTTFRGTVLAKLGAITHQTTWHVVEPLRRGTRASADMNEAVQVVLDRDPISIDLPSELQARVDHRAIVGMLSSAEVFELAERSVRPALPLYEREIRRGADRPEGPEIRADRFVRVPVPPFATPADIVEAARSWLQFQVVRPVVERDPEHPSVLIEIGPGLEARTVRRPGGAFRDDSGRPDLNGRTPTIHASIVRPVQEAQRKAYRLWVNRQVASEGADEFRYTAVSLAPFGADWHLLDQFPGILIERISIEPGEHSEGRLEVGGERLSVVEYLERLPATAGPPFVLLIKSPKNDDKGFVRDLSQSATVLLQERVGGYREWSVWEGGEPVDVVPFGHGVLDAVLERSFLEPVDAVEAVADYVSGYLEPAAGSDAARVIRRFANTESLDTRTEEAGSLDAERSTEGWVAWPEGRDLRAATDLVGVYPAGVVPVRLGELPPTSREGFAYIPLIVPGRHVGVPVAEGDALYVLVDAWELIRNEAVIAGDGHVTTPGLLDAGDVDDLVTSILAEGGASTDDHKMAVLLQELGRISAPDGGASLAELAGSLDSRFAVASPAHLSSLAAGAITPIRVGRKLWVAIGTDDPRHPIVRDLNGSWVQTVDSGRFELLLDSGLALGQVDLRRRAATSARASSDPEGPVIPPSPTIAELPWGDDQLIDEVNRRRRGQSEAPWPPGEILEARTTVRSVNPRVVSRDEIDGVMTVLRTGDVARLPGAGRAHSVGEVATSQTAPADEGIISVAPSDLPVLLAARQSTMPGPVTFHRVQLAARAKRFGARTADRFAKSGPDRNGSQKAAVRGLATLAFLQAVASLTGSFEHVPLRSVLPLSDVLDGLVNGPDGPIHEFLNGPGSRFDSEVAAAVGKFLHPRPVTVGILAKARSITVRPSASGHDRVVTGLIEVELLSGHAQLMPLTGQTVAGRRPLRPLLPAVSGRSFPGVRSVDAARRHGGSALRRTWPLDLELYPGPEPDGDLDRARAGAEPFVPVTPAPRFEVRRFAVNGEWITEITTRVLITDPYGLTADGGHRELTALRAGLERYNADPANRLDGDRLRFRVEKAASDQDAHVPVTLVPRDQDMGQDRWLPNIPPAGYAEQWLRGLGLTGALDTAALSPAQLTTLADLLSRREPVSMEARALADDVNRQLHGAGKAERLPAEIAAVMGPALGPGGKRFVDRDKVDAIFRYLVAGHRVGLRGGVSHADHVKVALTELPRLLRQDVVWASIPGAGAVRAVAQRFGAEMRALFARSIWPTAPGPEHRDRFPRFESADLVEGFSQFAVMAALFSAMGGPAPLELRPRPAEILGRLVRRPEEDWLTASYRAPAAGQFLMREAEARLAGALHEIMGAGLIDLGFDAPGPSTVAVQSPDSPDAIEIRLLDDHGRVLPLDRVDVAWSTVETDFGPQSELAQQIHGEARTPEGLTEIERDVEEWARFWPIFEGEVHRYPEGDVSKVLGLSRLEQARPVIGGPSSVLTADELIGEIGSSVVELHLTGDADTSRAFAQRLQSLAERAVMTGRRAPEGISLVLYDPDLGQAMFHVVERYGDGLVEVDSAGDAVAMIRQRPPYPDPIAELRARIDGYTSHPQMLSADLFDMGKDLLLTAAGRLGQAAGPVHYGVDVLNVMVGGGAGRVEEIEAARSWLTPGVLREVLPPVPGRTVEVEIGPLLRAEVISVPATEDMPALSASMVRPVPGLAVGGVWVNRYETGDATRLLAVPLRQDLLDWSFLDELHPAVISGLIIEPGTLRNDALDVDGRSTDAISYRGTLPDPDRDRRPIVILQHPSPGVLLLSAFVQSLRQVANVVFNRVDDSGDRSWFFVRKREISRIESLGELPGILSGPSRTISLRDALEALETGTALDRFVNIGKRIRRALDPSRYSAGPLVHGWMVVPESAPSFGPLDDVLDRKEADLVRLWPAEPVAAGRKVVPVTVEARYVGELPYVDADGGALWVIDALALVDEGAYLSRTGHLTRGSEPAVQEDAGAVGGGVHKISGLTRFEHGQPVIGDPLRPFTPEDLIPQITSSVVELDLAGDAGAGRAFAQRLQSLAARGVMSGRLALEGTVLVLHDSYLGQSTFHVVERYGDGLVEVSSPGAAVAMIRQRPPFPDPIVELRSRIARYTADPHLPSGDLFDVVKDLLLAEVARQVRPHGPIHQDVSVLNVMVRPGAGLVETIDAARSWLTPGVLRNLVPDRPGWTVPVEIGAGLRAEVLDLSAIPEMPAAGAVMVRPVDGVAARTAVWVNRSLGSEGERWKAVPLDRTVVDWSFLDELPPDVIGRLRIEPGQRTPQALTVDGESMTAVEYSTLLPPRARRFRRPIVVLVQPEPAGNVTPFVEGLLVTANVLTNRIDEFGRRNWTVYKTHGLGISVRTPAEFASVMAEPSAPDVPLPEALVHLNLGATVLGLGGSAVRVRRAVAAHRLSDDPLVRGRIPIASSAPSSGPVDEVFGPDSRGLLPLWPAESQPQRRSVPVSVEARYVGAVPSDDGWLRVVDLRALLSDGAYLSEAGHLTRRPQPSAQESRGAVERVLRENSAELGQRRLIRALERLAGEVEPGGGDIVDYASARGAAIVSGDLNSLAGLEEGAITPVLVGPGLDDSVDDSLLVIGSGRPDQPILLTSDGLAVDPAAVRARDLAFLTHGREALLRVLPRGFRPAPAGTDLYVRHDVWTDRTGAPVPVFIVNDGVEPDLLIRMIETVANAPGRWDTKGFVVLPAEDVADPGFQAVRAAARGLHLLFPRVPGTFRRLGDRAARSESGWQMQTPNLITAALAEPVLSLDEDGVRALLAWAPAVPAMSIRGRLPGVRRVVHPVPKVDRKFEAARAGAKAEVVSHTRQVPHDPNVYVARFDVRRFTVRNRAVTEVTVRLLLTGEGPRSRVWVNNVFADLRVGLDAFNRADGNILRDGSRLVLRVERVELEEDATWVASVVPDSAPMNQFNLRANGGPAQALHEFWHALGMPDHRVKSDRPNVLGDFDPDSLDVAALTPTQLEAFSQLLWGRAYGSDVDVLPESVAMMTAVLDVGSSDGDLPAVLADNLAPEGLRLHPAEGADRTPAGAWVRKRFKDQGLEGVRKIDSGADLEGLFHQSGDRGVVLLFGEQGRPEVYMRTDGEVWHFTADASGVYRPERWGGPGTFDDRPGPRRYAIGFNSCGDFVR